MDRTITFNSVTLKNTQTEPQKQIIFSKRIKYKKNLEIKLDLFCFPENYSMRVCKSTDRKILTLITTKSLSQAI